MIKLNLTTNSQNMVKPRNNYKKSEKSWLYVAAFFISLDKRQEMLRKIQEESKKNTKFFDRKKASTLLKRDVFCLIFNKVSGISFLVKVFNFISEKIILLF